MLLLRALGTMYKWFFCHLPQPGLFLRCWTKAKFVKLQKTQPCHPRGLLITAPLLCDVTCRHTYLNVSTSSCLRNLDDYYNSFLTPSRVFPQDTSRWAGRPSGLVPKQRTDWRLASWCTQPPLPPPPPKSNWAWLLSNSKKTIMHALLPREEALPLPVKSV